MFRFIYLFSYIIRSFKNYFKIITDNNINNLYLPNLGINNTIMIDPNKIKYINSIPVKFNKSTKFIMNFDWDKDNKFLRKHEQEHHTYVTCRELFVEGMAIEKCKEFFFFKKQIHKNKEFKNCRNHDDIIFYLNRLIKLYESIKKIGVRKNINNNLEFIIDRNYNLVKINSGNHRFSISRILKLKKIPVEIKIIHTNCFGNSLNNKFQIRKINQIIKNVQNKYC